MKKFLSSRFHVFNMPHSERDTRNTDVPCAYSYVRWMKKKWKTLGHTELAHQDIVLHSAAIHSHDRVGVAEQVWHRLRWVSFPFFLSHIRIFQKTFYFVTTIRSTWYDVRDGMHFARILAHATPALLKFQIRANTQYIHFWFRFHRIKIYGIVIEFPNMRWIRGTRHVVGVQHSSMRAPAHIND